MRNGFTVDELTRPARWEAFVSSMRGHEVLATRIPVLDGRVSIDGEGQVPERADLSFTPEYKPVSPFSPLAAYGQELFLTITVTIAGRSVDYEIGAFLVDSWEEQTDGTIKVAGVGLLQRVADDPAALPSSPVPGSTLRVEASRLAHPVPVVLDHGVEDVALPRGLAWGTDRLDALADLIASHGLRGVVRNDRQLHLVRTVTGAAADRSYSGRDLAVSLLGRGDHARANVVSVVSREKDGEEETITVGTSEASFEPYAPATYGRVHRVEEVEAVHNTAMLNDRAARFLLEETAATQVRTVEVVADPAIELWDTVSVAVNGEQIAGRVRAVDMPLDGGVMRLDMEEDI
ncbi:hypothetical protein [Gleimia europaea]|uniref:hypothetical protein n=1 Tax=Gleimia europaea TaxID=66228 RepID=UPI000C800E71|nr:hypothetical protein [Gleimia europaea]WIK62565.1 hypothetical protein CJ185_008630 [Gleimia europaea]